MRTLPLIHRIYSIIHLEWQHIITSWFEYVFIDENTCKWSLYNETINLNLFYGIEYRTKFWYRQVSNFLWYRTSSSLYPTSASILALLLTMQLAYPSSGTPALEARRSTTYRVGSWLRRTHPDSGTHSPPPCRCRSLRGGMATWHSRPRLRPIAVRLSETHVYRLTDVLTGFNMIATDSPCRRSWMAPGQTLWGYLPCRHRVEGVDDGRLTFVRQSSGLQCPSGAAC